MKKQRLIALLMALTMLLTLCACGKDVIEVEEDEYIYFGYEKGEDVNFPDPENPMNPAEVYANLQLTEKMLYGCFEIAEDGEEQFAEEHSYAKHNIYDDYYDTKRDRSLSSVPYKIEAGYELYEPIVYDKTHEWAELSFMTKDGDHVNLICTYTVEDNVVSFTPLNYYQEQLDENYYTVGANYELGDEALTYEVQRTADTMTLTDTVSGESVTLYTDGLLDDKGAYLSGVLTEGCSDVLGLSEFYVDKKYGDSAMYYFVEDNLEYTPSHVSGYASATVGGLINFWFTFDEDDMFKSFVYLCCGYSSCVLIDEDGVAYYYIEDLSADKEYNLVEIDDATKLRMQQTRTEILDALVSAMEAGGIDISVNYDTGEVSLDAGILFDVNSYDVSDAGKATLDKFIEIYTSVVFSDQYKDCISNIVVEGHTDTNGDYSSNMTLSENRANAVLNYCLGCSSAQGYAEQMENIMSAVGMSWDSPVYNDDGSVNMDASRRVSFRIDIAVPQE